MAIGDKPTRRVKTSDTIFEIIESIQELDGATLAEVADHVDFAKSTVHDHLSTLEDREYVVKSGDEYTLSLKFLNHGLFAKKQQKISHVGKSVLEDLAGKTTEVAWIIVEEHGQAVYLEKAMGENAVQTHAELGGRQYLHRLASGKAIMAHLPDEQVDKIIARHGLPESASNTITNRDDLQVQLEQIREEGIAINDNETIDGLRAIAAPVFDGERVIGAVAVSGPESRMTRTRCYEEVKPPLLEAVNEIELKLQYPTANST